MSGEFDWESEEERLLDLEARVHDLEARLDELESVERGYPVCRVRGDQADVARRSEQLSDRPPRPGDVIISGPGEEWFWVGPGTAPPFPLDPDEGLVDVPPWLVAVFLLLGWAVAAVLAVWP